MAQDTDISEGLRRSVRSLIQTLGATTVQLRLPAPPVANDSGEELGLRAPEFQARPLTPVAVRRSSRGTELLVPADVLEQLLGVEGSEAVTAALQAMYAVTVHDQAYLLTGIEAILSRGRECMYRIALRLPDGEVE